MHLFYRFGGGERRVASAPLAHGDLRQADGVGEVAASDAVFRVAPDLAVEILSPGNTPGEMQMKLDECRQAGVRLVWHIDPAARMATVPTLDGRSETLDENGVLDGGDVLPGFALPLRQLLDRFPRG